MTGDNTVGLMFIAGALMLIFFAGDPGLNEALVTHLMNECPSEIAEAEAEATPAAEAAQPKQGD